MIPELQEILVKTVGLAIAIYVVVWIVFHLLFHRMDRAPRFSLHLFALSLGTWMAGRILFTREAWVGHVGAGLIFATTLFLWVLFDRLICGAWLAHRRKIHIPIILRQLGGVLVVLVAGSCILKWGYRLELTGLLATSGIAAVILGFAMQDLLANVIAGFSIHMTGAYRVGDWLLLGQNGERAEVTEINWRSTRFVNNDHVSFEIPNSDIVKNRIVNLNYPTPEHGIRLRMGLDYDVPPALAKQALLTAAVNAQGVIGSPAPTVFLCEFGDHSVIYELRVWMHDASLYNVACDDIRTALWYELKRRDIRIPFPIRSLEVRKSNEPGYFADAKARAAEIVAGNSLSCLTSEEARALAGSGTIVLFGPGEALVTCGETGDSMFVILDGRVKVSGKSDAGTQVVLARLGPGECFGEISLLTGAPRNATVCAEMDTLVLEIRKKDIYPLIDANPALAGCLGELLERRQTERFAALHGNDGSPLCKSQPSQSRRLTERILSFFSSPS
jgi:small-conductance mechanosensitive channel/CRP-like cAMP-binding protein